MTDNKWGGKRNGAGRPKGTNNKKQYSFRLSEGELKGCVPVDATLKEILEDFMDIHAGFAGVEHQWLKTCYYYQYYGPSQA